MKNRFGVDVSYMTSNLEILIRDMDNYTPEELNRVLSRLADVAAGDQVRIQVGDLIRCRGEADDRESWRVVELPGCSEYFPRDYRAIDLADGFKGLISPEDITQVNGKPWRKM